MLAEVEKCLDKDYLLSLGELDPELKTVCRCAIATCGQSLTCV